MQEVSPGSSDRQHPKNVFDQLWLTQLWYNQDLRLLLREVRDPLLMLNLLPLPTILGLFSGLDSIVELSDTMLPELEQLARRYNPATTCLSIVMNKYIMHYQVYLNYWGFIYIHWHPQVQELKQLKKKFNSEIKNLEARRGRITNTQHQIGVFTIEDFLVRPKSRIIFVKLLMEEHLRKLSLCHPDRIPMENTVMQFNKLCQLYNERTQMEIENYRLRQLMLSYGQYFKPSENRQFICQWPAMTAEKLLLWIYVFNDLILLTRRHPERQAQDLLHILDLDQNSSVIPMVDGSHIQNTILVSGAQSCVEIRLRDSQRVQDVTNMIYNLIYELGRIKQLNRLAIKNNYGLAVKQEKRVSLMVDGCQTMHYGEHIQNMFYVKVISSARPSISTIIVLTYDKIKKIQKYIKSKFAQIVLPLSSVRDRAHRESPTQTIEFQWLSTMLLLETLSKSDKSVMVLTGLNPRLDYLMVNSENVEHDCNVCCRQFLLPRDLDSYMQYRRHYIINAKLLCSKDYCLRSHVDLRNGIFTNISSFVNNHQKTLLYLHHLEGRMDEAFKKLPKDKGCFDVVVSLCSNTDKFFRLTITTQTTVGAILQGIFASIGSYVHYDYGLFVRHNTCQRLLQDSQTVYDILVEFDPKNKRKKLEYDIMDFRDGLKFELRKYFFIDRHIQWITFLQNEIRLEWLVFQIFSDISEQLIVLSPDALVSATAYYVFLKQIKIKNIESFSIKQFKFLPKMFRETANHMWLLSVMQKVQVTNSMDRKAIMSSMLELVQDAPTYGTYVCRAYDNEELRLVGINFSQFIVMDASCQQILLKFKIEQIRVRFEPTSIVIVWPDTHRFQSYQVYSLRCIYDRYMMYNRLSKCRIVNRHLMA